MPKHDLITLTGLRGFGHHGVFDFETQDGQEFVVDLEVALDIRPASTSDDVVDTIHYGELAVAVVGIVTGEPVQLIETLAERIAALVLEYPQTIAVTVTVRKPQAPSATPFGDAAVTITRKRQGA